MYIDDALSINSPDFTNWIPLKYPKGTTETIYAVSFLDIYLKFEDNDQLSTIIYDNKHLKISK
jgi:hypothetical protein